MLQEVFILDLLHSPKCKDTHFLQIEERELFASNYGSSRGDSQISTWRKNFLYVETK